MDVSDLLKSRFLKKEDCEPPLRLTIAGVEKKNMSRNVVNPEYKIVLEFTENCRLTLNQSNLQTVAKFFGTETDDWIGKQIGVQHNPGVEFEGEIVGGIRVISADLVPKQPTLKRKLQPKEEIQKEIPF
jgi:hypothetical protein